LSNKIFEIKSQDISITEISIDNFELSSILNSFFEILNGFSFSLSGFEINIVQSAIDLLGFSSNSFDIPTPSNFEESVFF
jgi:hypothetical protein